MTAVKDACVRWCVRVRVGLWYLDSVSGKGTKHARAEESVKDFG
jgi:hypothetical protein